jgi:L-lactate dehydrogenase complex protein LldF
MGIVRDNGCRRIIKSKSMVSEEVNLTRHMEEAGLDVAETDLGEFIAQIARERPSHIVGPIIHMNRQAIAGHFARFFKTDCGDEPAELTRIAREHLREKFRRADLGMTGGNFLVAETGQVCVVENEGNARQSVTTPKILVSMVGIEKVIPRLEDLGVMLKLLGRSSTGQPMTVYTNLFGGPRAPGELDGPEQFHLVLVDNGRSRILAGEYREALRCIRCGACLNACPVYRTIGGQAYGHIYSGPIGAVLAPLLTTLAEHKELPQASSLCGACGEVCPVKIDLPGLLLRLRRDLVAAGHLRWRDRLMYRFWAWTMNSPSRYRLVSWLQRRSLRRRADGDGWVQFAPGLAAPWTASRDLPAPAPRSFRQLWAKRGK